MTGEIGEPDVRRTGRSTFAVVISGSTPFVGANILISSAGSAGSVRAGNLVCLNCVIGLRLVSISVSSGSLFLRLLRKNLS